MRNYIYFTIIGAIIGWWLHGLQLRTISNSNLDISLENSALGKQITQPANPANPLLSKPKTSILDDAPIPPFEKFDLLYEMYYVVDQNISPESIKNQINEYFYQQLNLLKNENRIPELIELLEMLIIKDSGNAEYYYHLAEAQHQLELDNEALYSLSMILYDPIFGGQAQALATEIQGSSTNDNKIHVPLEKIGEHYIVNAKIPGHGSVRLVIDTGASLTTLTPQAIQRLGLNTSGSKQIKLKTAGGSIQAQLISLNSLSVKSEVVQNIEIAVIPLNWLFEMDGLLGMNYLKYFDFMVDQESSILILSARN